MDEFTLILHFLRVVAYAVFATYFTYLTFVRQRDQLLYGSLALQFGLAVIWMGIGAFSVELEAAWRPWQTLPVLLTLAVIVRDFLEAQSRKARTLRTLEAQIARSLEVGSG